MPNYPFFCGKDCGGDACALLATVENEQVTSIHQNPAGGRTLMGCRRGFDQPLFQNAPDRILTPLIRSGARGSGEFREASWDEALNMTAGRLREIQEKYGPTAILNQSSAGDTGAVHCTYLLLARFLNLFGGCTRTTGSYSTGAASFILPYIFGADWTNTGMDAATMLQSEMIILWGANLLETRLGSQMPHYLSEAFRRGKQIVVIDPRRSATVKNTTSWWIPIRPGTDAALMLAVLHVLMVEKRVQREFVSARSIGFDQLERYVLGLDGDEIHDPAWAEKQCGISAEEIIRFARAYADARPAMLIPGYSIQRVYAGEEPIRLAVSLQLATGNFGTRGGSTGSLNNLLPTPRIGRMPVPPAADTTWVTVVRWPDAVLQGREGGYPSDIHAIYCMGSNFLNQGADINKSIAAFKKVDFSVCHEIFLTPTARHCDVVFPAATAFEKEDIGIPWMGNYLLYRPQIVPPRGQARSDFDILGDLAERLGFGKAFTEGRSAAEWVQHFLDQSEVVDQRALRRDGVYQNEDQERVGLADFARDPVNHRLRIPSGKVEIASQAFHRDTGLPAIPTWMLAAHDEQYPLLLITPKSPHRTHSQGNLPELRDRARHALVINPQDAASRGIRDDEIVRLFNQRGEVRCVARVTEDLAPGVVCLPEGMWVEIGADGIDLGGAANILTGTDGTPASMACIMHGVGVEVARIERKHGLLNQV